MPIHFFLWISLISSQEHLKVTYLDHFCWCCNLFVDVVTRCYVDSRCVVTTFNTVFMALHASPATQLLRSLRLRASILGRFATSGFMLYTCILGRFAPSGFVLCNFTYLYSMSHQCRVPRSVHAKFHADLTKTVGARGIQSDRQPDKQTNKPPCLNYMDFPSYHS